MATRTKLQGIDADAHVIETERTRDYLEPAQQRFRAVLVPAPYDPTRQLWAVEGRACGLHFPDMSQEQLGEISQRARRNKVHQVLGNLDEASRVPAVQPLAPAAYFIRWLDGLAWWSGLPAAVPLPTQVSGGGSWRARPG